MFTIFICELHTTITCFYELKYMQIYNPFTNIFNSEWSVFFFFFCKMFIDQTIWRVITTFFLYIFSAVLHIIAIYGNFNLHNIASSDYPAYTNPCNYQLRRIRLGHLHIVIPILYILNVYTYFVIIMYIYRIVSIQKSRK